MGKLEKLTVDDRAWLCSGSSYAKVKSPDLEVMATSSVAIMLHNLRYEIEDLEAKLKQLHAASERMRSDLLIRGETEANGTRVVNVSSSVWNSFCDALDEARS